MTYLVVGAGPAGLMAAEALADAGKKVLVVDQKPSVGRKFLMAGKSGLNLTKDENFDQFCAAFGQAEQFLTPMLRAFGPREVQAWAGELGQEIFTGSSGRVFPKAMKASPLLRSWLARLSTKDVEINTRLKLNGLAGTTAHFEVEDGALEQSFTAVVLALGGASWSRLGSDGSWASWPNMKPLVAQFKPSNMGFRVAWSDHMTKHFGTPVKNIGLGAGNKYVRGEIVLSRTGIEGGGIYAVAADLRDGADLKLDLLPDLSEDEVRDRLNAPKGKMSLSNFLRKRLRFDPVKIALLNEVLRPFPQDLAGHLKALNVPLLGPEPIDHAISTAGGIHLDALDETLMLRDMPGVFVAGEMLDWEAPTGGYLITGCLATGRWAGRHAADWRR